MNWDDIIYTDWQALFQKYQIEFGDYYNPIKLLTERDADGDLPGIIGCCSNRSAGKTTAFLLATLALYKEYGVQCILLYRYSYELNACSAIFEDALSLYPDLGEEITAKPVAKGLFYQIFNDGQPFGFALSLNNVDSIKKYSPMFAKTFLLIMDEFQTESGSYLSGEVTKLQSLLLSVSRGGGKQSRFMRLCLLSNNVSLLNPYFIHFGIYKYYQKGTKILHGKGYVFEFSYNSASSKAIRENGLFKAFEQSEYTSVMSSNEYLIAADTFIQKPKGRSKYIFTILYDSDYYGVWDYFEDGYIYVSTKYDKSYKMVVTFRAADHMQTTVMLNHYDYLWNNIREAYKDGMLRFSDMKAKNMILDVLAIDLYK